MNDIPLRVYCADMTDSISLIDKRIVDVVSHFGFISNNKDETPMLLITPNDYVYTNPFSINLMRHYKTVAFGILRKYGITVPEYYYSKSVYELIRALEFDKQYVIKPLRGARSIGQAVVTGSQFIKMTNDIWDVKLSKEEFNLKHNIDRGEYLFEDEQYTLYNDMRTNEVVLTEKENVVEEYRVIAIAGCWTWEWVYEKRVGYLAGSPEKRTHSVIEHSDLPETLRKHAIIQSICNLLDGENYPFASFDIYITKDGTIGCFEFDPSGFGIDYPDKELAHLRRKMTTALYNTIKKQKGEA